MTFLEYLQDKGIIADGDGDLVYSSTGSAITQNDFSVNFTAWLKSVFSSQDFQSYVDNLNLADEANILTMLQNGTYHVELNQNSEAAPYVAELKGLVDFDAFFGVGVETDVKTGKVTQERWYVNDYGTHDNPFIITFNDEGQAVINDGAVVPSSGLDGSNGEKGADGTDASGGPNGTSNTEGLDGTEGGDGTTVASEDATLGGGDGGFGGDGGTGGDGAGGGTNLSGKDGGNGNSGGNGSDTITITDPGDWTSILIDANDFGGSILGGDGGNGGNGGAGGNGAGPTGNGGNGGDGGAGGNGGYAIVNGSLSTVSIVGDHDLIILGGNGGIGGDGGAGGLKGGSGINGTAGNDGADGATSAAFSDAVDVDASAFTGHLTISGSDSNDTMVMGSGGSDIYDTLGNDMYTLGNGAEDVVHLTFAETSVTDTVIGFETGSGGDVLDISDLLIGYDGDVSQFVDIDDDGSNTTVKVDANGGGDNGFQAVVVLQDVTGSTLSELINNGNIQVV